MVNIYDTALNKLQMNWKLTQMILSQSAQFVSRRCLHKYLSDVRKLMMIHVYMLGPKNISNCFFRYQMICCLSFSLHDDVLLEITVIFCLELFLTIFLGVYLFKCMSVLFRYFISLLCTVQFSENLMYFVIRKILSLIVSFLNQIPVIIYFPEREYII